jgi:hypothetical protein
LGEKDSPDYPENPDFLFSVPGKSPLKGFKFQKI